MRLLPFVFIFLSLFAYAEETADTETEFGIEAGPATEGQPVASPHRLTLNDALAFTLKNQLELKIQLLNVQAQHGVAQQAAGPFDPTFNGSITQIRMQDLQSIDPPIKTDLEGSRTVATISATKRTRLGTRISANAEFERVDNPFVFPRITSLSRVSFFVDQPLLRNFRLSLDTVNEQAAWLELWAIYMESFQNIARHVLDSTLRYWELVSARKLVDISIEAEERLTKLEKNIQRLIDEEQLAKVDITQAQEKIVEQQLLTYQAKQQMYTVFELLKLAIGDVEIYPCDLENPYLLDDFVPALSDAKFLIRMTPALLQQAETYRHDVQAFAIRERAANILLRGAHNQALPEMNVFGGVSRHDFQLEGCGINRFSSINRIDRDHPQTDWTVGINFSMPLYNDFAFGLITQRQAQQAQAILRTQFLVQTIVSELRTAISNQISLVNQLKQAKERVELSLKLIDDEWQKLLAGYSTLFVLLDFETRYTNARNEYTLVYKNYMQNIATIRFLTGTLFESDDCLWSVLLADVTTLEGIL